MADRKSIVIIGNGISGITAARHIRKLSDHRILVISAETKHFFSRTALMYIYMGHMKYEHTKPYEDFFWAKNRIDLMHDRVESIEYDKNRLSMQSGASVHFDELIIAVGSKPNKFGWPGQDLDGVQGLYSYQDLQLLEKNTHPPLVPKSQRKVKRAVIVGGGLIGVELAEMLLTRNIEVTFLVREDKFWGNVLPAEEGKLISDHIKSHHVDLRFNTELGEIHDNGQGRVNGINTKDGEFIECELVGLTAGVSPNIGFLKNTELETNRGVLVDRFLRTNQRGVYAIGDCAEFHQPSAGRRLLEQVWYTGRMMGETVAQTICGKDTEYKPGHWFNSAKFFDIEYQTYGWVRAQLEENEEAFYWEHENHEICLKLVYDKNTRQFIGANTFGIRMRHEVFSKWMD
ncbi:MAG: NAD(P)/FAD-dependent oxidoreductase, partial [Flavobacteriales bacterium]|nr:NAD(P)/FAD-dependent oxidoreductase [Flavobacteriales bacterium]